MSGQLALVMSETVVPAAVGWEQPRVDPPADGVDGHAELVRGTFDAERLAAGVRWWGGRDLGVFADRADTSLGERQAGAGQSALTAEDPGNLPVAVMLEAKP